MPTETITAGYTPNELARLLRCSPDRVRAMIVSGEIGAINMGMSRAGRARYVILPAHLAAFEQTRSAAPPPKPARRKKRTEEVNYFPDL